MNPQQPISWGSGPAPTQRTSPASTASGESIANNPAFKAILERLESAARDLSRRSESLEDTKALSGAVQTFYHRYYQAEDPNHLRAVMLIMRVMIAIILSPLRLGAGFHRHFFKTKTLHIEINDHVRPEFKEVNLINMGAIPTNLGYIIRVFYLAQDHPIHLMVGRIYPWRFLGQLFRAALGRSLANATLSEEGIETMLIQTQDPDALLHPIIDGEQLYDWATVKVSPGPVIQLPEL